MASGRLYLLGRWHQVLAGLGKWESRTRMDCHLNVLAEATVEAGGIEVDARVAGHCQADAPERLSPARLCPGRSGSP